MLGRAPEGGGKRGSARKLRSLDLLPQGNVHTLGRLPTTVAERVACPVCRESQFETRMEQLDLPYFEEVIQLTYACDACGFRRTDLHITKQEDPARYELEVTAEADLDARVVRSASGHFEIPELDIRAEPGQAADSFITNAEGVLSRCVDAIETAMRGTETEAKRERAQTLLDRAERLRSVEETWTLVIEDPLGNSAIIGESVSRYDLTEEEVEELGLPYPVVDLDERRGETDDTPTVEVDDQAVDVDDAVER